MRDGLLRNRKMIPNRPVKVAKPNSAPVQALCWCGQDGHFGFARGGPLFCARHVERDGDGFFHPIPQS